MGNFLTRSRHGTVFYFRRRVPAQIQSEIGRAQFVVSLGTSERTLAIKRARAVAAQTDELFTTMKKKKLPTPDMSEGHQLDWTVKFDFDKDKLLSCTIDADNAETSDREHIEAVGRALLAAATNQPTSADQKPRTEPKPFKKAIEDFLSRTDIKSGSKRTYISRCVHAQEFFGGESANVLSIDQADFVRYCDHVKATVPNVTTQMQYLNVTCGLLNWHRRRTSGLSPLSTKSLLPKKTTPDSDDRDAFEPWELEALFKNAAQYRTRCPSKFWLSIAPVMLGCRIEEICQVHLEEDLCFDKENNIWFFDFNENPDSDGVVMKSLKKLTSWRHVPIPSALVKLGFIAFLQLQKSKGLMRPFLNEWKPREADDRILGKVTKWSVYPSKWAGRELKAVAAANNFDPERKHAACHSMRHTHRAALGRAGVKSDIAEAIQGRRYGGQDNGRYQKLVRDHKRLYVEGTEIGLGEIIEILERALGGGGPHAGTVNTNP